MSPASGCPPTSSAGTCGWPATTCSWSRGTDEHGTPIQVQADKEGVTPRELADRYNRVIVEDLHGARPVLRPVHPHHHRATTTRSRRSCSRACTATATSSRKTTLGAISPSTGRTLPDRYIEGTCPICGYDSARGDQCDNCGNQLDPIDLINPRSRRSTARRRSSSRPSTSSSTCRRFAEALGEWLRQPRAAGGPTCCEFSLQPARRPPAPGDHPRPRLGRADPAGRLAGPHRQADLRLVRRGHRLPVGLDRVGPPLRRPGGVAQVVVGRRRGQGRRSLLLHGQGQHRLPLGDLAGDAARLQRRGRQAAASRARWARSTCPPRWSPASS